MNIIKFKSVISLLRKGELKFICNGILKRLNSKTFAIGFKRDLNIDFQNPNAKIEIKIRQSQKSDNAYFINDNFNYGLDKKNIKNCYVAITIENIPCFRNYLIDSSQNEIIKNFWTGSFPNLNNDEALLEGGFASPPFRGKGIMPAAVARISAKAHNFGARYVITFVDIKNIPSLKGIRRSGFHPYTLRCEKWFLFKKRVGFMDIPKDKLEKYYSDTSN